MLGREAGENMLDHSGRCLGREAAERATNWFFVWRVLNKQYEGLFR